ncbi:hypothetical protein NDU88_003633 [Pleurodeles waltl]|uniref:Uncharacterized protein n=1 Tax=Pleurodeles waltl TaxID=8319 RepID=A0AAV7KYM4_PLEWA|nr:hypothetical protein NDU88_003633 [Pleurodeles waltl]
MAVFRAGRAVYKAAGPRRCIGPLRTPKGAGRGLYGLTARRRREKWRRLGKKPAVPLVRSQPVFRGLPRVAIAAKGSLWGGESSSATLGLVAPVSHPRGNLTSSDEEERGVDLEDGGEADPSMPVSKKWPTVLEWSTTDSEGEDPGEAQGN